MGKIKIEIKNRWTDSVLFEYEKENNTVKDTVEKAIKQEANLSEANLSEANLSGANLSGANLRGVNLCGADLCGANLSGANLSGVNLGGANLCGANLSGANLSEADLCRANLSGANLSEADLCRANLYGADLCGADLCGANLSRADLDEADLKKVQYNENTAFYALQCPEAGSFVGYKICKGKRIVKLLITEDSKRSSATTRKCRASKVKVLEITNIDNTKKYKIAKSKRDSNFEYKVGETIEIKDFDENRWNECSAGIHFFLTRDEAVQYD